MRSSMLSDIDRRDRGPDRLPARARVPTLFGMPPGRVVTGDGYIEPERTFAQDDDVTHIEQLALIKPLSTSAAAGGAPVTDETRAIDPGRGEVFTRRWVAELILDLVGFDPRHDLGARVLVEPSCGSGAFLMPVVERLVESARVHGRRIVDLGDAIRAFEMSPRHATVARASVIRALLGAGVDIGSATGLASEWVTEADFLLTDHVPRSADFVVGNPPYVRLEDMPKPVTAAYRLRCPTMRGRADIYVGFIERGLELLKPGAALSYICADRWMHNQYGAALRDLVSAQYAVETVLSMHDVDAFEDDVSAYPAVVVLRNAPQGHVHVADTGEDFDATAAHRFHVWRQRDHPSEISDVSFDATRVDAWYQGRGLWPNASPNRLALLAELEARFPTLEDPTTGTRVGIGVATGCDDVYITDDPDLVEPDRLVPLLRAADLTDGSIAWTGRFLVNPWQSDGLVDLAAYPRLADYFDEHAERIRGRHVARQRPQSWYRTIDRVHPDLTDRPKLVIPDIKASAHPVLDHGGFHPHHNLYHVVSDGWDLDVLGGLLLSEAANLFVGAYCVKMRGGTYRFQAQYLRKIRVPDPASILPGDRRALAAAFDQRDVDRATGVAERLYDVRFGTG